MPFFLHLVILTFFFSCKAEINQTYFTAFTNKTSLTDENSTSSIWGFDKSDTYNNTLSNNNAISSVNQDLYISESTKLTTTMLGTAPETPKMTTAMPRMTPESTTTVIRKMAPYTTTKKLLRITNRNAANHLTNTTPSTQCVCKDDRYKTGIVICAIIIAVLVLICAALIICSVALANKVSSLKTKLTQSKRQARSNGDFLSASSLLWPSGMETWQKKSHTANQTMDEISLADTIISDEKHKLMTVSAIEKSNDPTADNKTTSAHNESMTIISTVEV